MTIQITDQQFIDALEAAVAERGRDFVYPRGDRRWSKLPDSDEETLVNSCLYVKPDGSGAACLIGLALHKAGVPLDYLAQHEGDPAGRVMVNLGVSWPVRSAAGEAQSSQDLGATWGDALDEFYRQLRALGVES